jgi:hypothetical protein
LVELTQQTFIRSHATSLFSLASSPCHLSPLLSKWVRGLFVTRQNTRHAIPLISYPPPSTTMPSIHRQTTGDDRETRGVSSRELRCRCPPSSPPARLKCPDIPLSKWESSPALSLTYIARRHCMPMDMYAMFAKSPWVRTWTELTRIVLVGSIHVQFCPVCTMITHNGCWQSDVCQSPHWRKLLASGQHQGHVIQYYVKIQCEL